MLNHSWFREFRAFEMTVVRVLNLSFIFATLCNTGVAISQQLETPGAAQLSVNGGGYLAKSEDPFSFSEVEIADINNELYGQEPASVLAHSPSIISYSDSGSSQGYSYFRLRGIDQTRINMTLDGVPLNEPEDQGVYFSNFPDFLSSLEKYQVHRGLGVSQNGSSNFGGSILFESFDLYRPKRLELGSDIGSFGSYHNFLQFNSGVKHGNAAYIRVADIHSDGYKHRSANDSHSIFYKLGHFSYLSKWTLSGFVGAQQNELAWIGSTKEEIDRDRRHNANADEDDSFLQTLIHLQNIWSDKSGNNLTTSLYYNHLGGNYDFDLNNFLGLGPDGELFNYKLTSDLVGFFSNYQLETGNDSLIFGVHVNNYRRNHLGREKSAGTIYKNNGQKDELSAFVRGTHTWRALEFVSDFQLRSTSFKYNGDVALEEMNWTFFNPKLGVVYFVEPEVDFYYSIGRTGREPTRNDILAGNDNLITDERGDPLLGVTNAEYVIDHELGVRFNTQRLNAKSNLYYMDFDQEIALNGELGPSGLPLTASVDRSYRSGVEVELTWQPIDNFESKSAVSYNKSRVTQSADSLTPVLTPRWDLDQSFLYNWDSFQLDLDLHYQSSSFIDFANSNKIDEFLVANLSGNYTYDGAQLSLSVNNLFNQEYLSNGYVDSNQTARYYVQAPRTFWAGVKWSF